MSRDGTFSLGLGSQDFEDHVLLAKGTVQLHVQFFGAWVQFGDGQVFKVGEVYSRNTGVDDGFSRVYFGLAIVRRILLLVAGPLVAITCSSAIVWCLCHFWGKVGAVP